MKVTKIFVLSVVGLAVVYDVVAIFMGWWTMSRFITGSSTEYLAIPFAAGFLCGHLFWSQGGKADD